MNHIANTQDDKPKIVNSKIKPIYQGKFEDFVEKSQQPKEKGKKFNII